MLIALTIKRLQPTNAKVCGAETALSVKKNTAINNLGKTATVPLTTQLWGYVFLLEDALMFATGPPHLMEFTFAMDRPA